jgi:PIN domain nuclease of toxin-antitoxin system
LDTHALLWWISDDSSLTQLARRTIADTRNTIVVSAASAWEIATKVRIGMLPGAETWIADFVTVVEGEGFILLPILPEHGIRAGLLTGAHKDPFDRMLLAQAQAEGYAILSNEQVFDTYGVRRIW